MVHDISGINYLKKRKKIIVEKKMKYKSKPAQLVSFYVASSTRAAAGL